MKIEVSNSQYSADNQYDRYKNKNINNYYGSYGGKPCENVYDNCESDENDDALNQKKESTFIAKIGLFFNDMVRLSFD